MTDDGADTTGQRHGQRLEQRLGRLAPAEAPDPARLAAARTALQAAIDHDGSAGPRGPAGGGAHVIDLVDDRVRVDLVDHAEDGRRRTTRHHTARHRGAVLGAAAAGVGVVAAGVLLVSPAGPDLTPASPVQTCADLLTAEAIPGGLVAEPQWRTIAHERWSAADLTLLSLADGRIAGFCALGEGTSTTAVWSGTAPAASGPQEVVPRGTELGEWSALWGTAGAEVDAVEVTAEWSDDPDGSVTSTQGMQAEARLTDDGYWSAFFGPGDLPEDAVVTLVARLADGSTRSFPLDAAWADADSGTSTGTSALADARRAACAPGAGTAGSRPVLEVRRGDHGVTFLVSPGSRQFVLCLQEADAPYGRIVETSGRLPAGRPAPAEATAVVGGASGPAAALVGVAGTNVGRVQVTTAAGARIEADLVDGHWVAWGADLPAGGDGDAEDDPADGGDPWEGAVLTWFGANGAEIGSGPAFG